MNSQHFSEKKIRYDDVLAIPKADLRPLGLDATESDSEDDETSIQHIPLVLEYNTAEAWYWRYGEERLYAEVFCNKDNPKGLDLSWSELHCWVTNYAWVEPIWRFILNKPCWPLHSEVVDRVVALYLGRRYYEEHRAKATPKDHSDFFDLAARMSREVQHSLVHCEIQMNTKTDEPYPYIRHSCEESTRGWIPSLLHRVLAVDGVELPASPVMDTAFGTKRFDSDLPVTTRLVKKQP